MDFDQHIDAFYEPLDILKYDKVTISFNLINDLDKIQEEQRKLVEKFNSDNNFIDETIHEQLLESAKTHGDLRNRELALEPIVFQTDSFFTKTFGGIYLLRDFIKTIVVFEDKEAHKKFMQWIVYNLPFTKRDDKNVNNYIVFFRCYKPINYCCKFKIIYM